jgi:hypothetical protein
MLKRVFCKHEKYILTKKSRKALYPPALSVSRLLAQRSGSQICRMRTGGIKAKKPYGLENPYGPLL